MENKHGRYCDTFGNVQRGAFVILLKILFCARILLHLKLSVFIYVLILHLSDALNVIYAVVTLHYLYIDLHLTYRPFSSIT